jgi:hypothetical protein
LGFVSINGLQRLILTFTYSKKYHSGGVRQHFLSDLMKHPEPPGHLNNRDSRPCFNGAEKELEQFGPGSEGACETDFLTNVAAKMVQAESEPNFLALRHQRTSEVGRQLSAVPPDQMLDSGWAYPASHQLQGKEQLMQIILGIADPGPGPDLGKSWDPKIPKMAETGLESLAVSIFNVMGPGQYALHVAVL